MNVKLNVAPQNNASRIAVLDEGQYAFVGFHRHTMNFKNADKTTRSVETFAPVLAKLDANLVPVGLYAVNRSDLTKLEAPRIEFGKTTPHNNTGSFVEAITPLVNKEGYFNDALWMNDALPRFANAVLYVKTTRFLGTSKSNTSYNAKVYDIAIQPGQTFNKLTHQVTLNNLMTAKTWKPEDCPGFDGQIVTFEFDGNQVNLTNDWRLA